MLCWNRSVFWSLKLWNADQEVWNIFVTSNNVPLIAKLCFVFFATDQAVSTSACLNYPVRLKYKSHFFKIFQYFNLAQFVLSWNKSKNQARRVFLLRCTVSWCCPGGRGEEGGREVCFSLWLSIEHFVCKELLFFSITFDKFSALRKCLHNWKPFLVSCIRAVNSVILEVWNGVSIFDSVRKYGVTNSHRFWSEIGRGKDFKVLAAHPYHPCCYSDRAKIDDGYFRKCWFLRVP